jgi:four helix bundle protein
MNYASWEETVPDVIKKDSLWRGKSYRLSLFLADLSWHDTTKLSKDKRTEEIADQLYRAVGSISANLAEGYSMGTGKNRARYYEYALGSAREARGWYYKGRHILGQLVVQHRYKLFAEIIPLLLTMIPQQRQLKIQEEQALYRTESLDLFENPPYS